MSIEKQLQILTRGVETVVPVNELAKRLAKSEETGVPLRVKYGIDPTGPDVHLGHVVPLKTLRQFQKLGHTAVIVIGDFTAVLGDPSERDETRSRLTAKEISDNATGYIEQVGKIIDLDTAEIHHNSNWLGNMRIDDVVDLCSKVTVNQMIQRDDFAKRLNATTPIRLYELLYPLMQAWDSVEVRADVEVGGTEQLFSFMLARSLQWGEGTLAQVCLMSPILVGIDGVRRMGKTLDNYIGVNESPFEMIKKLMQLPDECTLQYIQLLTKLDVGFEDFYGCPKALKLKMAVQVIANFHPIIDAVEAKNRWQREIGDGGLPEDIPIATIHAYQLRDGDIPAYVLFHRAGLCYTTSDARRLIQGGGAKLGEGRVKITDPEELITVTDGLILWAGKKRICQLTVVQ